MHDGHGDDHGGHRGAHRDRGLHRGHAAGHDESGPAHEHKAHAPARVNAFVITSSDTRTEASDDSGRLIKEKLEAAGHGVAGHRVVRDEPSELRQALEEAASAGAGAVIINGGTGIGRRDQTIETLRPMLEKELPGFGEIFRTLSFEEIGSPAMFSRALAGTWRGMILFALPGSPQAARLAMDELILPELGHAVRELTR
ncbi:MAG TPA: molybdenum cofactor biosynthesis protein B [Myxococcaceae bacterium]|jgi:molybdenum cofactor biosynthesis protein B|nr:molybdenum cofactor biosynthesis protein B [Myxococcaceae bacterium]